MASVYLAVWLTFLFALSNALVVRNGEDGLISAINTVQIVQLGLLSIIPYWGELALESGLINVRAAPAPACRLPCRSLTRASRVCNCPPIVLRSHQGCIGLLEALARTGWGCANIAQRLHFLECAPRRRTS